MTKYGFRNNSVNTKKLIIKGKMPVQYTIPLTVAESTAGILSAFDLASNGTAAISGVAVAAQPPYPMQLKVWAGSAGTAGNTDALRFVGYDAKGEPVSDTCIVSSTAGASTCTSNAYAKLTSITPNAVSASASVGVGYTRVIGLPYPLDNAGDILSYTYDGAYGTAEVNALTMDATYDTLTMPTMAADKQVNVLYLSRMQELERD